MGAAQGRTGLSQGIISFTVSGAACVCFELARIRANIPKPVKAELDGVFCFQMWGKNNNTETSKKNLNPQNPDCAQGIRMALKPLCQCVAPAHNGEGRTSAL